MSIIKCFKLKCEICGKEGTAQVWFGKNGDLKFGRIRHYRRLNEAKKPVFEYHAQTKDYLIEQLKFVLPKIAQAIDQEQENLDPDVDQNLNALNSNQGVEPRAGFGPATITLPIRTNDDLTEFKQWLVAKEYSRSYISKTMSYANRFSYILKNGNLRELDLLSSHKKDATVKSLILLSKFNGSHTQFKASLSEYGIKLDRPNGLNAFLRILNASNSDVMEWLNQVLPLLRENERLFAEFLQLSGLRTSETINSFNLIIQLNKEAKLSEYYDSDLNVLCHFKYPKLFIRRTKTCYITFVKPEFLNEIAASQPVTYSSFRKRLDRKKIKMRFNELRDYFGTYLLNHGILEAEINLCQGRIPVDIFIRHYWSPKLKELGDRIFKALETISTL